jgi:signal transduction histidine kinase
LRDMTTWKQAEKDLLDAKREAERASAAKADFLAKVSHEIRTPLNAIIGFSEVMVEERFGSMGNERYRDYLKDIHECGGHLVSLVNDLLDLSKVEAGRLDLAFTSVNLNQLTQQCVAIMQSQAHREHIIIRTSLFPHLPSVVADARSVRQIVLNLLSNSIKVAAGGGQVIVSTTLSEAGEVVLRLRDTGVGMSETDLQTALEPFRQVATSTRWGSGGTGLGLPLTKALAEANRAHFGISSAPNAGTMVEITFPPTRVLAE